AGVKKGGAEKKVEPSDPFHIGSCTKSMTATLAAILVEKKSIEWTRTVAQAFPDLKAKIHRDYHSVTLLDLLAHRGGLPEGRAPDPKLWPRILQLNGPISKQRLAFIENVHRDASTTKPGTAYAYSNAGYTIAGAMLKRAGKKSYEDLIRELLFEPLEMRSAGFGAPGAASGSTRRRGGAGALDVPWGHHARALGRGMTPIAPGPRADNPQVIAPAGTVHVALADWARYISLHLRGARGEQGLLLAPESFEKLHARVASDDYALGWVTAERGWAKGRVLTHSGSNGSWFAVVWIAPNVDL